MRTELYQTRKVLYANSCPEIISPDNKQKTKNSGISICKMRSLLRTASKSIGPTNCADISHAVTTPYHQVAARGGTSSASSLWEEGVELPEPPGAEGAHAPESTTALDMSEGVTLLTWSADNLDLGFVPLKCLGIGKSKWTPERNTITVF